MEGAPRLSADLLIKYMGGIFVDSDLQFSKMWTKIMETLLTWSSSWKLLTFCPKQMDNNIKFSRGVHDLWKIPVNVPISAVFFCSYGHRVPRATSVGPVNTRTIAASDGDVSRQGCNVHMPGLKHLHFQDGRVSLQVPHMRRKGFRGREDRIPPRLVPQAVPQMLVKHFYIPWGKRSWRAGISYLEFPQELQAHAGSDQLLRRARWKHLLQELL